MKNYLKIILCAFVLFSLSLPIISAQAADNPLLPGNADGTAGTGNGTTSGAGGGSCDLTQLKDSLFGTESASVGDHKAIFCKPGKPLAYGRYQFLEGTVSLLDAYKTAPPNCKIGQHKKVGNNLCHGTTGFATAGCAGTQEAAMDEYTMETLKYLQNKCPKAVAAVESGLKVTGYKTSKAGTGSKKCAGKKRCTCTVTWSGLLAGGHIGGKAGICNTISANPPESGDVDDGYTSRLFYVCEHGGLPVPEADCSPKEYDTDGGSQPAGDTSDYEEYMPPASPNLSHFPAMNQSLKNVWVAAFQLMTAELTTFMMTQVQTVGMFFDAKHQLETQRLLQEKVAQAHKDYHPSEQMCMIGTFSRNLMNAERRADVTKTALTNAMLDRALATSDAKTSREGLDQNTKQNALISTFCNKNDNANNNKKLCPDAVDPAQVNADISYTRSVDMPLTLDVDFLDEDVTKDEENIFAFLDYIFMHEKFPWKSKNTTVLYDFIEPYMDMRSTIAIRSVAQNSFAEIIALKTSGADGEGEQVGPFMKALLREFGIADTDIEKMIGENPSYYAQMEILTKTIYQHPEFISNLYDKPTNVKRIQAALTAIKLMQDRDIHDALLRREMLMSMLLELQLRQKKLELINEEITPLNLRPAGTADSEPPTAP